MSLSYSQTNQYISSTNTDIINVATPYLSNVKAGDLLLLFWGMAEDDRITLDDAGWTEKTECNPLLSMCEVRMYYKYATSDNEQVTTYTLDSAQTRFMCTRLIKGAHATIPFIDAQNWSSSSSSNTLVRFPAMTATANNQLCIYMGMSDADNIVDGTHGKRKIASDSDYRVYEQVVNSGAVAQFDDSISSDQACAFGVIINDAASSPLPLVISPTKSLTKLTPDSRNDTGWREKIYDSGYDILTGETRVDFTTDLTVYHVTNQWAIRIDQLSDYTLIQVGETMTIGSATGTVAAFQASSSSRGYIFITSWSGTDPTDNAAVTFGTSGVTGQVWGAASYHHDLTGYFRSSIDLTMLDYTTMKFTGAASIGIADGVHFVLDHSSMNSEDEGYWFKTRADDRAYYESSDFTPIAASPTGVTISPYGMVNNTLTYVEGTENRYDYNSVTSIKGWNTNLTGTAASYTTPKDWSSKKIGLWYKLYNNNVKYGYFLLIDDNDEWKLWRVDSYYRDEYNGAEIKHYTVDPNSIDTPLRTSDGTFDATNIKYYACLYQQVSSSSRYPLDIYDQYEIATQTVTGGNADTGVRLSHIEEMINSELTLGGQIFNETLFSKIPSQYILSRSIKLSCAIDMQNQSLTFPLQTDYNQEFWWNVDAEGVEIETDGASGNMLSCLFGSDKGALLTNTANDTIDYTGTIFAKYTPSLQNGKIYSNNSFVECGQIAGNGATIDGCTISNSSDSSGAYLLVSGSDTIKNSTVKNNDIGILVSGTTAFTLENMVFDNNTKDLHFSATTGSIDVTVEGSAAPSYTTDGVTVNILAPTTDLTISGCANNTEIRVYRADTMVELMGIENSSGDFTDAPDYKGAIIIVAHHLDYLNIRIEYTLTGVDAVIPIQQTVDSTYVNP